MDEVRQRQGVHGMDKRAQGESQTRSPWQNGKIKSGCGALVANKWLRSSRMSRLS